jgi:hypothetical protein
MVRVRFYCQIAKSPPGGRPLALNRNELLDSSLRGLERAASDFGISATIGNLREFLDGKRSSVTRRVGASHSIRKARRAHLDWVADLYAKEAEFATSWARSLPLWPELSGTLPNEL